MRPLDWIVFLLFLGYVVWDGARRARGSKDLEGYFAGSRQIPWWAAGLSIMATQLSAITVIGTTGQGHEKGMDFVQTYLGLPFAMILLCVFFVPLYRRRSILTPYEYLEGRFGPLTRALASLLFLLSRCLALGVVIYAPAVVLSAMLGLEPVAAVLVIGGLTTLYTTLGGVAAVIWTDVKQMAVILVGLLLVFCWLLWDLLPVYTPGEMLQLAGAAGRLNALEVLPAHDGLWPRTLAQAAAGQGAPSFWEEKYNLLSGLFGGLFLHLSYFGCDHSQAQRLLTSKDERAGRLSLLLSAFVKAPMQAFVLLIGVLLWLFYAVHGQPLLYKEAHRQAAMQPQLQPQVQAIEAEFAAAQQQRRAFMDELAQRQRADEDPALLAAYQGAVLQVADLRRQARTLVGGKATADGKPKDDGDTNDIFCRFLFDHMPPVVLGLLLAAIFAAAMSSIDSTLNALSAATVVDLYRRWLRPSASEAHCVRAGRALTFAWGAVATAVALSFDKVGSVVEQINQIGSLFYGSLLGVFVLALSVRRAGPRAGVVGLCCGMALTLLVHFTLKVEFLWYNVIGCVGVLAGGLLALPFERRGG